MAYPTVKATTTHLDQGSDSPSQARGQIKQNIDNVNALIDYFNGTGPIKIQDNEIEATRSNDNLILRASGTGEIIVDALAQIGGGDFSGNFSSNARFSNANIIYKEDLTLTVGTGDRSYKNNMISNFKLSSGQSSSNSNDRFRQPHYVQVDMNGSSSTSTSGKFRSRGPQAVDAQSIVVNTGSGASTLGNASGVQSGIVVNGTSQNITLSAATGIASYLEAGEGGSGSVSIGDFIAYYSMGDIGGDATVSGNMYHFYANDNDNDPSGNTYAFFCEDQTDRSRVGTLEQYRERVVTSGSTSGSITIDCDTAPVHIVNQSDNTTYTFSNLSAGQSVTLIIKTTAINKTATFTSDGSTKVKFPDGDPILSTATGATDIVVVFFDGTDHLGAITQNYTTG